MNLLERLKRSITWKNVFAILIVFTFIITFATKYLSPNYSYSFQESVISAIINAFRVAIFGIVFFFINKTLLKSEYFKLALLAVAVTPIVLFFLINLALGSPSSSTQHIQFVIYLLLPLLYITDLLKFNFFIYIMIPLNLLIYFVLAKKALDYIKNK